jgi:hypothetical protein
MSEKGPSAASPESDIAVLPDAGRRVGRTPPALSIQSGPHCTAISDLVTADGNNFRWCDGYAVMRIEGSPRPETGPSTHTSRASATPHKADIHYTISALGCKAVAAL